MDLQAGVIVAENYRLESLLGRGGMGVVWKATDLKLGRPVALKILHTDLRAEPKLAARFEREARLLASIEHPAIVGIYTWLTIEDGAGQTLPCIVMPFVNGMPLWDVIRQYGAMRVEQAVPILAAILEALSVAHAAGIIHRDLKPQNVILEQKPGRTQVRLLDFGIAKSLHEVTSETKATQAGSLLGTPGYMSPEQIQNPAGVDARADLWAAAVCFYEMITGRLPYDGATPIETLSKVLTQAAIPATHINPNLPSGVNDFFVRALARDIQQRPPDAAEMSRMLDALSIGRDKTAAFVWPPPGAQPMAPSASAAPIATPAPVATPAPAPSFVVPSQATPPAIGAHNFQATVGAMPATPSPVSVAAPSAPAFAAPSAPPSYAVAPTAPPNAGGFGAQPASGFGAQPAPGFGASPATGFGAQPAGGFGAIQAYGSGAAIQPGASSGLEKRGFRLFGLGLASVVLIAGSCSACAIAIVLWRIFGG